jgi:hypothetical protein
VRERKRGVRRAVARSIAHVFVRACVTYSPG